MSGVQTTFHPDQVLTADALNQSFGQAVSTASIGVAGGVPSLGSTGKVPAAQLPPAQGGLTVASTAVNGSGHLIITYSDGSTYDAGLVTGSQGAPGPAGPQGKSVVSAALNGSNHLILTFSDASTTDVGSVLGPAGPAGTGLTNKGTWVSGTSYNPGDYVFGLGSNGTTQSMWVLEGTVAYTSTTAPRLDTSHWAEFQAPAGPQGATGTAGRSVTNSTVNGSGHLVLTYSDNTTTDAGLVQGAQGTIGPAGRSVSSSTVNGSGHLIITYSDTTNQDVGAVVGATGAAGPTGTTGAAGPQGVSITNSAVNSAGHLILTYSDTTTRDAGPVVGAPGAPGRAISASGVNSSGHLILTYSDGTTSDAGNVQGPAGSTPNTSTLDQLPLAAALSDADVVGIVQPSQTTGSRMLRVTLATLKTYLGVTGSSGGGGGGGGGGSSGAPALPTLTGITTIARYSAAAPGTSPAAWADIGGNGWNLTANSSNPLMTVDGSNRKVCRFNGSSDTWRAPSALYSAMAGPSNGPADHSVSIMLVFNNTNGATGGNLASFLDSTGNNNFSIFIEPTDGWANGSGSDFGGANDYDYVAQFITPTSGLHSVVAVKQLWVNSGYSDVTGRLWVDGTDYSNGGGNNSHAGIVESPTYTIGFLGSYASGGAAVGFCKGDLYEAIFFTGVPTSGDVAALHQWAQTNFGAP